MRNKKKTKIKFNYAIVCDDVRREDNGKMLLIGVYGNDIAVPSFPSRFQLYLFLCFDTVSGLSSTIDVRVLRDGREYFHPKTPINIESTENGKAMIGAGGIPIVIEEECVFDFQIKMDDGRFRSVSKLMAHQEEH